MYKEAACPLELILWDLMTSEKNKRSKYHFDSRGEHYNLQQVPDPREHRKCIRSFLDT